METKECLKYIVEEIHTAIVATVDDEHIKARGCILEIWQNCHKYQMVVADQMNP